MLSVILTILKVIGIILLIVLGLLLTVALIVLFVPIRYRSQGEFKKMDEGFKDNISVRVTWLLHILSISFKLIDTESEIVVKIFGKKLSIGANETKTSSKRQKKSKTKSQFSSKRNDEVKSIDNVEQVNEQLKLDNIQTTAKNVITENEEQLNERNNKKSIKQKLTEMWQKLIDICQKIKNVKAIKDEFVNFLKKEESKNAIREIKTTIFKVIKKILPIKLSARLRFGFEDPSTTGNVLGIASVFYGIYGDKFELEPDFEQECLEGEYSLKGKIRVITLVCAALKIYRNRWLRRFISFSKKTVNKI